MGLGSREECLFSHFLHSNLGPQPAAALLHSKLYKECRNLVFKKNPAPLCRSQDSEKGQGDTSWVSLWTIALQGLLHWGSRQGGVVQYPAWLRALGPCSNMNSKWADDGSGLSSSASLSSTTVGKGEKSNLLQSWGFNKQPLPLCCHSKAWQEDYSSPHSNPLQSFPVPSLWNLLWCRDRVCFLMLLRCVTRNHSVLKVLPALKKRTYSIVSVYLQPKPVSLFLEFISLSERNY